MSRRSLLFPLLAVLPLVPAAHAQVHLVANRFIVAYRNAAIPGDAEAQTARAGARLVRRHERFGIAVVQTEAGGTEHERVAESLRRQPGVEAVVPDRVVAAHRVAIAPAPPPPSQPGGDADALYRSPQGWAVRQVGGYGSPGPWETATGIGVRIAILDSGVDAAHPDIAPNLALSLSEVDQNPATGLPSPCDDGTPQDQSGHGTWTASLAAAASGPGTGETVGVAPGATILNVKVLERLPGDGVSAATCETGEAAGLLSWVIAGIDDAVANRADVISMSLGALVDVTTGEGAGLKAAFDRVTYAAAQAGTILVAAAGNDGFDLADPRYVEIPAQSRGVLAAIAATNPACGENLLASATACVPGPVTMPYYSNYGAPLDALAAPGGSYPANLTNPAVASGWVTGACSSGLANTVDGAPGDRQHSYGCFNLGHTRYVQAMGTSASAPLLAGAAALMWSGHPGWTAAEVVEAMRDSAVAAGSLPVAQVNAAAGLALAQP